MLTIRGAGPVDFAVRYMALGEVELGRSANHLSTGLRVRVAADDAAALNISTGMSAQVRGLHQSAQQLQDGINLLNIADGTLGEAVGVVQRMRELAVQARSSVISLNQRRAIGAELLQLRRSLDSTLNNAQFNGTYLFRGVAPAGATDEGKSVQTTGTLLVSMNLIPAEDGPGIDVAAIDVANSDVNVTDWTFSSSGDQLTLQPTSGGRSQTVKVQPMVSPDGATQILNFSALGIVITLTGYENPPGTQADGATIAANIDGTQIQTTPSGVGGSGGVSASTKFVFNPLAHGHVEAKLRRMQTGTIGGGDNYWISDVITDENAVSTMDKATTVLAVADTAVQQLTDERGRIGAETNMVRSALSDVLSRGEQLETSRSRIVDADLAQQSVEQVRASTLQDLRTTVAREASRLSESALALIRSSALT